MRRIAGFLVRLYPRAWRERYGDEFRALLEDTPPGWSTLFDLLKGAIQMQIAVPNFSRLAVILSAAGLVAGLGASFLITPEFVSTSELSLSVARPDIKGHPSLADMFMRLKTETTSRTSLSRIIEDPRLDLYPKNRRIMPLEDVIDSMRRRDIRIEPVNHPGLSNQDWMAFTIRFRYPDPHKTQAVVQTLLTKFRENNLQDPRASLAPPRTPESDEISNLEIRTAAIERRLGIAPAPDAPDPYNQRRRINSAFNLSVTDPPSLPQREAYPNRAMISLLGLAAGFALALLLTLFRRTVPPAVPFPA